MLRQSVITGMISGESVRKTVQEENVCNECIVYLSDEACSLLVSDDQEETA